MSLQTRFLKTAHLISFSKPIYQSIMFGATVLRVAKDLASKLKEAK